MMQNFRLMVQCHWGVCSSGMFHGLGWEMVTDIMFWTVSNQLQPCNFPEEQRPWWYLKQTEYFHSCSNSVLYCDMMVCTNKGWDADMKIFWFHPLSHVMSNNYNERFHRFVSSYYISSSVILLSTLHTYHISSASFVISFHIQPTLPHIFDSVYKLHTYISLFQWPNDVNILAL